jgi:hypothetical protein
MRRTKNLLKEVARVAMLIVGLALSAYSWISTFSEAPSIITNWQIGLGIGLALFFVSTLWYIVELQRQYLWAKPDVELIHSSREAYQNGEFYLIAQLEIKNLEETEITDCYATLEATSDIFWHEGWKPMPLIPSLSRKPERITWIENEYSNDFCEITIPLQDSRHVNLADTFGDFHYNLRSGSLSPNWMLGTTVHTLKVRVDGKFNGKSMKPLFFDGYLYYELKPYTFVIRETKNGEFVRDIQGKNVAPYMIFEKGDWMKDRKIRKALEVDKDEAAVIKPE